VKLDVFVARHGVFVELTKKRKLSIVGQWIRALLPRTTERVQQVAKP